jgi:hypothetical protein
MHSYLSLDVSFISYHRLSGWLLELLFHRPSDDPPLRLLFTPRLLPLLLALPGLADWEAAGLISIAIVKLVRLRAHICSVSVAFPMRRKES